jgi:DNA-binding LacI/PurR family transcriptional regulator
VAEHHDVTAVFVANDQTALGLVRGLADHGLRVPDDVAVVGFDDFPQAAFVDPALTTVRVDFPALGRLAVAKLLALIDGAPAPGTGTDDLVVPELVVRASSGPPRGRGGSGRGPRRRRAAPLTNRPKTSRPQDDPTEHDLTQR